VLVGVERSIELRETRDTSSGKLIEIGGSDWRVRRVEPQAGARMAGNHRRGRCRGVVQSSSATASRIRELSGDPASRIRQLHEDDGDGAPGRRRQRCCRAAPTASRRPASSTTRSVVAEATERRRRARRDFTQRLSQGRLGKNESPSHFFWS
jgi:hypothetical protein